MYVSNETQKTLTLWPSSCQMTAYPSEGAYFLVEWGHFSVSNYLFGYYT
ncbi:hypothetical protein RVIR1_11450 [Candidatus Rickettsiella viridis]|uniref:Uncharacterized protein n=1 Tax=Candidatus Rickettsiella viridis TaxID=676208 RepID=A0A2Z5UVM3_9COXI|nr:hypothetical protein RVIR1_11450 [Candidatus Rickettsiella viridis]